MKRILSIVLISLLAANIGFCSALTDDYVDIASSYVQQGKYSQAYNYINKALEIESGNQNLINMQNDLYKLLGNDDIPLMFDTSTPYENYLGAAVLYYENGKYKEAKEKLNKYLEVMPKSDFAYMLRAKVNMNLDETPSALRDIKSAQTISNNYEYELVEALILYKNGKYSQSRDILLKLSENVQIYNVYKYLGLCNLRIGNYKEAVENFDRAILLSDEDNSIVQSYNEAKRMSYGK